MKDTKTLLEILRTLAFAPDGRNGRKSLENLLVNERGGRVVEPLLLDYLCGHWQMNAEVVAAIVSRWALVEPGTFWMGSPQEEPGRYEDESYRLVRQPKRLLMQVHPVTQQQWLSVFDNNPSVFKGLQRPVDSVNWWEALAYCNALSRREGLEEAYTLHRAEGLLGRKSQWGYEKFRAAQVELHQDANGYRLPTDLEWEYACRAGTTEATYNGALALLTWGDSSSVLEEIAWYRANSNGGTCEVSLKTPNAWGLHDMLGNVWEWTWSRHESNTPELPQDRRWYHDNNEQDAYAMRFVIRGGGWGTGLGANLRAARRAALRPEAARNDQGFRCVRAVVV